MQGYDRYVYVNNSPINYADPSGHVPVDCYGTDYCGSSNSSDLPDTPSGGGDDGGGSGSGDTGCGMSQCDTLACLVSGGDECNVGHCYGTSNVVCPAIFSCTEAEMQEYATMFQFPGQNPMFPVQNGQTRYVFPANILAFLLMNPGVNTYGAIKVYITNNGLTLTNHSLPTHIFHNGQVVRDYSQNADGSWAVTSTGTGTNAHGSMGPVIDQINDAIGPTTFDVGDTMMAAYIIRDQLPSYVVEQISNLLP